MPLSKVIVVGAGPSGLLLTLLLARAGVTVQLLEMTRELDRNPRATHYMEPSCYELDRAGVLDEVRAAGFFPTGVSWRKLNDSRSRLVKMDNPLPPPGEEDMPAHRHRAVCLPLHELGKILERHILNQPTAKILYDYKVGAIGESDGNAWVQASTPDGEIKLEADYVVGCDGGNSTVRRLLFGEGVFPGLTWTEQVIATNVYFDFQSQDYDDAQFFVHPEHWHMVARISTDGMYRVSYGEVGGLSTEEYKERQEWKYREMLPGHPGPGEYNIVNFSPYKVHQRCVDKMKVGRFLLAADAAHLCNPL
jgi:2-polyprenyl-6-methoxyphenol hydroxylase-like FAD-dependent oxidoreductase